MGKTIEDWVSSVVTTKQGVQACIQIIGDVFQPHPPQLFYTVLSTHKEWARWKAVATQVQNAMGFKGVFISADIQTIKRGYVLDVQLSYRAVPERCLKNSAKSSKRKLISTHSQEVKSKSQRNYLRKKECMRSSTKKHS